VGDGKYSWVCTVDGRQAAKGKFEWVNGLRPHVTIIR
jgi:hypothetical protein